MSAVFLLEAKKKKKLFAFPSEMFQLVTEPGSFLPTNHLPLISLSALKDWQLAPVCRLLLLLTPPPPLPSSSFSSGLIAIYY